MKDDCSVGVSIALLLGASPTLALADAPVSRRTGPPRPCPTDPSSAGQSRTPFAERMTDARVPAGAARNSRAACS